MALPATKPDSSPDIHPPQITHAVPTAIFVPYFRQGIGRLIRTKKDKGIAVILDSRVLSKSYGRRFLAGLPSAPTITLGKEDI